MARPKGFEPLTPRFVVWCSIQLSYGRVPQMRVSLRSAVGNRLSYELQAASLKKPQLFSDGLQAAVSLKAKDYGRWPDIYRADPV
jgi:hypothetical protein